MSSCRRGRMVSRPSAPTWSPPPAFRRGAGLLVPTFTGDRICAITRFDNGVLPWFGLPLSLPG